MKQSFKVLPAALLVLLPLLVVYTNCSEMNSAKPSQLGQAVVDDGSDQETDQDTGGSSGNNGNTGGGSVDSNACTIAELENLEAQMRAALQGVVTDHSFYIELLRPKVDGRIFKLNRNIDGVVDENSTMRSASTAKLVTAVVIMDVIANPQLYPGRGLVGGRQLTLDSLAREFLPNPLGGTLWKTKSGNLTSSNRLFNVTLRHLLSFTSGLEIERQGRFSDDCIGNSETTHTYNNCIINLVDINESRNLNSSEPRTFYYNGAHLFVAAKIAVSAAGVSSWAELFKRFKAHHQVFEGVVTPAPSAEANGVGAYYPFAEGDASPNPAGALRYRAGDYASFLAKLQAGEILPVQYLEEIFSNQQGALGATAEYSPMTGDGEDWKYGLGVWNECLASTYSEACNEGRYSSPGSFGSYPFIDLNSWNNESYPLVGFIARGGEDEGTGSKGLAIYRALGGGTLGVKDLAQKWAANRCR